MNTFIYIIFGLLLLILIIGLLVRQSNKNLKKWRTTLKKGDKAIYYKSLGDSHEECRVTVTGRKEDICSIKFSSFIRSYAKHLNTQLPTKVDINMLHKP